MTRIVLLLCSALLLTHLALGQCKLKTVKDDFDGSVTTYTDAVKIASDGVGLLSGNYDCTYKIFLSFVTGKGKIVLVLKEVSNHCGTCSPAAVIFKLDDGTIITKTNVRYSPDKTDDLIGDVQSSYFDLSQTELQQLAKSTITKFRIRENMCSDHPSIEEHISLNLAKRILNNANCINGAK